MTTWEYLTTPLLIHNTAAILNNWGKQGWELVQVVPGPEGGLVAYLKRPSGGGSRKRGAGCRGAGRAAVRGAAAMSVSERLAELGIDLPAVVPPVAAYVPAKAHGDLVFTAGQLPMVSGALPATGKVGEGPGWSPRSTLSPSHASARSTRSRPPPRLSAASIG